MARKGDYAQAARPPEPRTVCGKPGCQGDAITRTPGGRPLCRKCDEAAHLAECRKWLADNGIVKFEMTTGERMAALARYRKSLKKAPKPSGLDWARKILQRMEDGENVPVYSQRLAQDALAGRRDDPSAELEAA